MLNLSEVLIQNPQIETFDELAGIIKERSKTEIFFRIDVKPPYMDTPENWEDRLEAMFTWAYPQIQHTYIKVWRTI